MKKLILLLLAVFSISSISFADETGKAECKARKSITRKFDKQYRKFSHRIKRVLRRYTDEEIIAILKEKKFNVGNVLSEIGTQADTQALTQENIRSVLMSMTTDEYRQNLLARLDAEIARVGSAEIFLSKLHSNTNWCLAKKITALSATGPAAVAGVIGLGVIMFGVAPLTGVGLLVIFGADVIWASKPINAECKFEKFQKLGLN